MTNCNLYFTSKQPIGKKTKSGIKLITYNAHNEHYIESNT